MSTGNERDNKENTTAKPASSTNDKLNDAAKTAGAMASKVFAKAKDAAADVKKELGNVNEIRKETFANAEAGVSKKDLAKGFWGKLSGKQKGLIAGIAAICIYFSYSLLFSGGSQSWNFLEGVCDGGGVSAYIKRCEKEALRNTTFPAGKATPVLYYSIYGANERTMYSIQPDQYKRERPGLNVPDQVIRSLVVYAKGKEPNSMLVTETNKGCEVTSLFRKKGSIITEEVLDQKGSCEEQQRVYFSIRKNEGQKTVNIIR
jgi:hypothetical protein